ncbi:MAG: hypothetical protein AAF939_05865 [Planctomycetota bacterium]
MPITKGYGRIRSHLRHARQDRLNRNNQPKGSAEIGQTTPTPTQNAFSAELKLANDGSVIRTERGKSEHDVCMVAVARVEVAHPNLQTQQWRDADTEQATTEGVSS